MAGNSPFSLHQMRLLKYQSLFLCICFSCMHVYGQSNDFENISYEQGLPGRIVNTIIQDNAGFIWFGSEEGLTRYDGYNCTVYKHKAEDPYSLSDNAVYAMCIDGEGSLWIATHNGLNRYDAKQNQFEVFLHDSANENSIASNQIFALAKDKTGKLWIATYGGGLDRAEKQNSQYVFKHHKHSETDKTSISSNEVFAIAFDKNGNGWAGTYDGLCIFNPASNKFNRFYHSDVEKKSITDNTINRLFPAKDGSVWLCGYSMLDKANFHEADKSLTVENFLPQLVSNSKEEWICNDFILDKNGKGWLALNDQGILKFSYSKESSLFFQKSYTHSLSSNNSLASSNVYSIYEDRSGLIWCGTSKGVSKYIPSKEYFDEWQAAKTLLPQPSFVLALTTDRENQLWLATDTDTLRILKKANNNISQQIITPVLSNQGFDQVNTMFTSNKGVLFMGTMLQGFFMLPSSGNLNKNKWKHIAIYNYAALPSNNIYAFAECEDGSIWIGTYKGLCKYYPLTDIIEPVYVLQTIHAQGGYIIRSVLENDNKTWCGTDEGLLIFHKSKIEKKYIAENKSNKLSNNNVSVIRRDKFQNIWVGTKEGLNLFKKGSDTAIIFTKKNGLPDDGIRSLIEDADGNIWIGTNHGLAKYSNTENKFYSFTTRDGISSDQFVTNSVCKGADGILYFGTNTGLVSFNPKNIKPNQYIPPLIITQIKVMNKNIEEFNDTSVITNFRNSNRLLLKYNQNFFSFEFAALNYINTSNNQYAYKLEGVDKDWNYSGSKHFAGYTDIKPGSYIFLVKGANNDGRWNPEPLSLNVIISPPWWGTWWFYMLCILILCSIFYIIYRVRIRQLLQLYKLRSSIAKDLHDDVGSALSSIAILSRLAQEGKVQSGMQPAEMYSRIGDTSKRMIDLMDDIVWSVNPDNDRFSNMLIRMREYAVEMLEPLDITIAFQVSEQIDELRIPMQMRKDYFLIFKEAVNNMAKYSAATKASIQLQKEGKYIHTTISDNGKGFDATKVTSGNGLLNMQSRASALNGHIEFNTSYANGTRIKLTIPVA